METGQGEAERATVEPEARAGELEEDQPTFATFLQSYPPNKEACAQSVAKSTREHGFPSWKLTPPPIWIYCGDLQCVGIRRFASDNGNQRFGLPDDGTTLLNIRYKCSNCQTSRKMFAIAIETLSPPKDSDVHGLFRVTKIGEIPAFGPPTPRKLLDLIDTDRDAFLKGRRCETQGLGIGAFSYYRRVVENQKNRILGRVLKVAEMLNLDVHQKDALKRGIEEKQFKKAMGLVKDAFPQSLLISGHNPMTILHDKLSDGIHGRSDEECLEVAESVRVILVELSERLSNALKDDAEIKKALSTLVKKKGAPESEPST